MAESLTIARPYAEAAFNTAREQNALPAWADALARLTAVANSPEAAAIVGNPGVPADTLAGVLADVAGGLTQEQRNFVGLLAQNDRIAVLPEIAAQFAKLRNAQEGTLDARVTSAFPLTDAQVNDLRTALEQKHGRKVEVTVAVDTDLIGGVSIRIGDEVTDASVRGKLARLAATLAA